MSHTLPNHSQFCLVPAQCQVWVGPCPSNLDPLAVHAMSSKGLTLFSIPRVDGRLCTILSWNDSALGIALAFGGESAALLKIFGIITFWQINLGPENR